VRSADEIELVSGDRHFRLFVSTQGSVVTVKDQVCSYVASRGQTVTTRSGDVARGRLYLVSSNGAAVAGASIAITDGSRTFTVRTGRAGSASFSLAKGPNRSLHAVYAGGSDLGPASLTFRVHDQR
jgi:hypothetical protein